MQTVPKSADFPVGVRHFECIDPDRIDRQEERPRRFMVTVFYPGTAQPNAERVTLADLFAPNPSEALEALAHWHKVSLPPDAVSRLQTVSFPAQRELEPDRTTGPYPILICSSPGEGDRFATAPLCIRLARRGFVVFSLDHPHDTKVVVYPDRAICSTPLVDESHMLMRIRDVARLVAHLDELAVQSFFAQLLDLQQIGIFGHSRGGATAVASTFWNDRIHAGINLDGYLFGFDPKNLCGLEHYPEPFQQKVLGQSKPILRLLGIPPTAGDLSAFFFEAESKVFAGPFVHGKLPGWTHADFSCDRMSALIKGEEANESEARVQALAHIVHLFFSRMLSNPIDLQWLEEVEEIHPDWEIKAKPFGHSCAH